ncbi:MAG TPA: hypothetical protein VHW24_08840 [Bryobacteraceae bacterium]|nr:hypothetical protein [Bryobacteraceae bacterium]
MRKLFAGLALLGGLALSTVSPALADGYYHHHRYYHHHHYRHHGHVTVIYHK